MKHILYTFAGLFRAKHTLGDTTESFWFLPLPLSPLFFLQVVLLLPVLIFRGMQRRVSTKFLLAFSRVCIWFSAYIGGRWCLPAPSVGSLVTEYNGGARTRKSKLKFCLESYSFGFHGASLGRNSIRSLWDREHAEAQRSGMSSSCRNPFILSLSSTSGCTSDSSVCRLTNDLPLWRLSFLATEMTTIKFVAMASFQATLWLNLCLNNLADFPLIGF